MQRTLANLSHRIWRVRLLDSTLFVLALVIAAGSVHGVAAFVDGTALAMGLMLIILFGLISHGFGLHHRAFFYRPAAARRQQLTAVAVCVVLIAAAGQILPFSPYSGLTPVAFALLVGPALLITRARLGARIHGWRGLPEGITPVAVWGRGAEASAWLRERQALLPGDWRAVLVIESSMDLRQAEFEGLPVVSAGGDVLGRELPRFGVTDVIIPVAEESQTLDPMIATTLEPQGLRLHLATADGLLRERGAD
jgi:FlaA1/EpsC-like NDP-sugar epimerase